MKAPKLNTPPQAAEILPVVDTAKRVALYLAGTRHELSAVSIKDDNGVIQLSGVVPTFYLRQLAVACARRVAGVQRVVDNMQVEYAHSPSPAGKRDLAR